jgi:hypothetical protein
MNTRCKDRSYDNFPLSVVALRASLALVLLSAGAVLLFRVHPWGGGAYIALTAITFAGIMAQGCSRCDYYGSTCDNGLSRLTALLFARRSGRGEFPRVARRYLPALVLIGLLPLAAAGLNLITRPALTDVVALSVYLSAGVLVYITTRRLACPRCKMNDVCPLGRRMANAGGAPADR